MKKSISIFSILSLASLCLLAAGTASANTKQAADWLDNPQQVLELAKKENKPILINFTGSDWCPPCIQLKTRVFNTPEFAEFAQKNLVLQVADFPRKTPQTEDLKAQNMALAQKYGIQYFPTLIILDSEGKMIGQMNYTGVGPKPFIADLQKIIAKK